MANQDSGLIPDSAVITSLKTEKGLALQDLITGAYDFLETVELPVQSRVYLLDHLGSCEYVLASNHCTVELIAIHRHRLSVGGSEKMQLTALLGAFKVAVELSEKKGLKAK